MITKSMLKEGYHRALVELIESPDGDGVVCQIGKMWFYFGGHKAEEMTVEEYKRDIPEDAIVDEIFNVLNQFEVDPASRSEYDYYEAFLRFYKVNGDDLDFWMKKNIELILAYAVSNQYATRILDHKDGWTNVSIMEEIQEDVKETSAYREGFWSEDDIRLAIGRVLMRRLGMEM